MRADAQVEIPTLGPFAGFPGLQVEGASWRAGHSPEGPVSMCVEQVDEERLRVKAWGPGAEWVVAHAAELTGCDVAWAPIAHHHPKLAELEKRHRGIRARRAISIVEAAWRVVIGQRVTAKDAFFAKRTLLRVHGSPPPGGADVPDALRLPPSAETLHRLRYFDYHDARIERSRAEIIRRVASRARRIEECRELALPDARKRLSALRGLGPWSVSSIAAAALGDLDSVIVGDYHLPNTVAWLLAGEERADDARMIELLEPFRPERYRVIQLLEAAHVHAPRRGPKMPTMLTSPAWADARRRKPKPGTR